MPPRQASIAGFLSPQTARESTRRLTTITDDSQTGAGVTKRRRLGRGSGDEAKTDEDGGWAGQEDDPDVQLLGVSEVKLDKGKGRAVGDSIEGKADLDIQKTGNRTVGGSRKGGVSSPVPKAAHPFFGAQPPKDEPEQSNTTASTLSTHDSKHIVSPIQAFPSPSTACLVSPSSPTPFLYPPSNHASYRLPPTPTYNHPIPISPPPTPLLAALTFNTVPRPITSPADLDLLYFTRFIAPAASRLLYKYLLEAMPWYRVNYSTKGIDIKTPRYTTVFGKDSTGMPWSEYCGWKPRAIPEILLRLMQKVEEVTGETYNFTLVNYYSSGTDSISYHSDSERFLGPNPCIASLSLGAPRDFMLRHVDYKTNGIPVQKFNLHDGDMVVMRGKTQHKYQHAIPKRAKAEGRINVTFRKGVVKYATENYLTYNVGRGPMFRWIGGKMVQQGE